MEEGLELPSKRVKKIIDHRQTGENQFFYRIVCQDGKQEWIQDIHLVGCDRLIQEFFTRQTQQEQYENETVKQQFKSQANNQIRTRSRNKKHEKKEQKMSKVADWNVSLKKKNEKKKRSVEKGKNKTRSKKYKDTSLLENKVRQLKYMLETRTPQLKLDYLLDYIEGVFMKKKGPYCVVKTMPPVRTYVVSLKDMEQYFPKTLKEYYENVLKLHQKTFDDSSSVYSDYPRFQQEEDELRNYENSSEQEIN